MLFINYIFLLFNYFHLFIFDFSNLSTERSWICSLLYDFIIALLNIINFISFLRTINLNFCSFIEILVWRYLTFLLHDNYLLSIHFLISKFGCTPLFLKHRWRRSFFKWTIWFYVLFTFLVDFKRTSWVINNLIFTVIRLLSRLFETNEFFLRLINVIPAHHILWHKLFCHFIQILAWLLVAIEPINLRKFSLIFILYYY